MKLEIYHIRTFCPFPGTMLFVKRTGIKKSAKEACSLLEDPIMVINILCCTDYSQSPKTTIIAARKNTMSYWTNTHSGTDFLVLT